MAPTVPSRSAMKVYCAGEAIGEIVDLGVGHDRRLGHHTGRSRAIGRAPRPNDGQTRCRNASRNK
jgi:hypothetical protein